MAAAAQAELRAEDEVVEERPVSDGRDEPSDDVPSSVEIPADVLDARSSPVSTTEEDQHRARAAARVTKRHERDAERAAAAAERTRAKEEEQRRRAETSDAGSEERKAAKARAAEVAAEQKRARQEARQQKAEAKQRTKAARAEAKREAKAARLEEREQAKAERVRGKERRQEAKRQAKEARHENQREHESSDVHAAAGVATFGATNVLEPKASEPESTDEPTAETEYPESVLRDADTAQPPARDRADELETTQPIARVQADREPEPGSGSGPEPKPKPRFSGVRSAGALVAAAVGILGLVISVVLAVGALTVALGAGEGNAFYDPLATVCNALVGPLKDAFSFSGPNAASREEFLGWGAGSLIYLAVSFAGQAAHRAAIRD